MPSDISAILRLEVPIVVEIGRRAIALSDVRSMVPGSIIELPKSADEELELLVNNKPIGSGIAVKVVENFGLQISFIGDLRARIKAMGGPQYAGGSSQDSSAEDADAEDLAAQFLAGQI
ncbi:MAG: FliM/FliN family flagellar motor switch protein [Phycisphaeraceae bacterium]|nr:FliM/FliN family flagellar motor switch protein [Phycisphaeraceae bacterium]MCB9847322.1 FliM/FliN family flagellar motor switch protein [Phycisphaeraceae bacterium]